MKMNQLRKGIAVGTDDYSKIIDNKGYFVDKTSLIKDVFAQNKSEVLLISRPRRFGKSLTMSMFYHFLSINHNKPEDLSRHVELFKDTKIFADQEFCQKFMGQYPVIFLSLKGIEGNSFEEVFQKLAGTIYILVEREFRYLLESDKLSEENKNDLRCLLNFELLEKTSSREKIQSSLLLLTQFLYQHYGKKAIVLIDEYDVPLAKASVRGYYNQMVDVIRGMLGSVLKTNSYLEKAVLTGCLSVPQESVFSGLNNISVNTVFSRDVVLATGIGFTKDETIDMLDYYGLSSFNNIVKEWYDGYNFANHEMFCAWDVVKFCAEAIRLENCQDMIPQNYWINTSSNDLIYQFLGYLTEQDAVDMQTLVDGGTISKKIRETLNYEDLKQHESDDFWSMLLYTGYLTVAGHSNFDVASSELNLRIPNKSIRNCFKEKIQDYFTKAPPQVQKAAKILQSVFNADAEQLRVDIEDALAKFISVRDFSTNAPKEYYYHAFLNGVFSTQEGVFKRYTSNQEAGNGYSDITILSKDSRTGYILELKYTNDENYLVKESKKALTQIEEQKYLEPFRLRGITKKVYGFGICFSGKSCFVSVKEYLINIDNEE